VRSIGVQLQPEDPIIRSAIFRILLPATVCMVLGLYCASARAADAQTLRAGDIATVLFPLVTFGIAYAKDDVEGEKEWLRDLGVNEVLNTGLRVAFNGTSWGKRPDGSSHGFPSGHAGFIFSQAGFLQERYGWKYGVPALAMATAISYIRVRKDKHHWRAGLWRSDDYHDADQGDRDRADYQAALAGHTLQPFLLRSDEPGPVPDHRSDTRAGG
jgi:hypothetical protein